MPAPPVSHNLTNMLAIGRQVVEPSQGRQLPACRGLIYRLCRTHNYIRHRCRRSPYSCAAQTQHSHGEEARSDGHFRSGSLYHPLLNPPLYANQPHSVW